MKQSKGRTDEEIREGYKVCPEAIPMVIEFEDLWAAFWQCCEYCGTKAALRTITEPMGKMGMWEAFKSLKDEVAGSWTWELEGEDIDPGRRLNADEKREERERARERTQQAEALLRMSKALLSMAEKETPAGVVV